MVWFEIHLTFPNRIRHFLNDLSKCRGKITESSKNTCSPSTIYSKHFPFFQFPQFMHNWIQFFRDIIKDCHENCLIPKLKKKSTQWSAISKYKNHFIKHLPRIFWSHTYKCKTSFFVACSFFTIFPITESFHRRNR